MVAGELRDRARVGLARKAAQLGERRGGNVLQALFPAESPWPAPLVNDAAHALRQVTRRSATGLTHVLRRIRSSTVRAVYQMPVSKEVFLGLQSGEVVCYRPGGSEVVTVAQEAGPILSIGAYGADEYLAVLCRTGPYDETLSLLSQSFLFGVAAVPQLHIGGQVVLLRN